MKMVLIVGGVLLVLLLIGGMGTTGTGTGTYVPVPTPVRERNETVTDPRDLTDKMLADVPAIEPGGSNNAPTGQSIGSYGEEGTFSLNVISSGSAGIREDGEATLAYLEIQAKGSRMYVERVRVDFGINRNISVNLLSDLTLTDSSGTVLAKTSLDRASLASIDGHYVATLAGFSYAIGKGDTGILYIKGRGHQSIDSASDGTYSLSIPKSGIRATDERGGSTYGPSSAISFPITRVTESEF